MVRRKKRDNSKLRKKEIENVAKKLARARSKEVSQTPCPSQPEIVVKAAQVEDKEEDININKTQLEDSVSHPQRRTGKDDKRSRTVTRSRTRKRSEVRHASHPSPRYERFSRSGWRIGSHSRRRVSRQPKTYRRSLQYQYPERRRDRTRSRRRARRSRSRSRRRRQSRSRSRRRSRSNPFSPDHARRSRINEEDRNFGINAGENEASMLPSHNEGIFARAMTTVEGKANGRAQGVFGSGVNEGQKQETSELAWAIAQKYMLSSAQQFNEKTLKTVLKNKGACADLKQALKARAAVYGQLLDPAWFSKGVDLSAKTKMTPKSRRLARAMFAGAVLFASQLGFKELRKLITDGDKKTLADIDPASYGTAAQFLKALRKAPLLQILEVTNKQKYKEILGRVMQHDDDLDYLQTLLISANNEPAVNPTMNALNEAFTRRWFSGRFRTAGRSIELDTIVHMCTKGEGDDDDKAQKQIKSDANPYPCFAFQHDNCTKRQCRFSHKCMLCGSSSHGSDKCDSSRSSGSRRTQRTSSDRGSTHTSATPSRPPHPRYRRDRARATEVPFQ